jgi:hypothetical protein
MSLRQRPWTLFDPADKNHRAYFTEFLQTLSGSTAQFNGLSVMIPKM